MPLLPSVMSTISFSRERWQWAPVSPVAQGVSGRAVPAASTASQMSLHRGDRTRNPQTTPSCR